jgi:hypothetical protein
VNVTLAAASRHDTRHVSPAAPLDHPPSRVRVVDGLLLAAWDATRVLGSVDGDTLDELAGAQDDGTPSCC